MPTSASEIRRILTNRAIYILPYSHSDWAWVHTRQWHEERYAQTFLEVLELCQRDPDFRWFLDTENEQLSAFIARYPDRMGELRKRVAEGRVGISPAGIVSCRPTMMGEECFLRNLILGRRYFEEQFPEADLSVFHNVDVAIGHSQLPQVLRKAGFKYARFWRPNGALDVKGVPKEFHWQGLDGTRILTSRGCYGGLCAHGTILPDFRDKWDEQVERLYEGDLHRFTHLSESDVIWLSHGADDSRPLRAHVTDEPMPLAAFIAEWNRREKSSMQFATPLEYFRRLESQADSLRTVVGVLDPAEVAYNVAYHGGRGLWRDRVELDRELVKAELLNSMTTTLGGESQEIALSRLWRQLLSICPHATQWLFEEDYLALKRLAEATRFEAESLQNESVDRLIRESKVTRDEFALMNLLPFERREVMKLHVAMADNQKGWSLHDAGGRPLQFQVVEAMPCREGRDWFEADLLINATVPAGGFTSVRAKPSRRYIPFLRPKPGKQDTVVNNGVLELTFRGGSLRTIRDDGAGITYEAPPPEGWGALFFLQTEPGGVLHTGPERGRIAVEPEYYYLAEAGPLRWRYCVIGRMGDHRVQIDFVCETNRRRVDLEFQIDCRGGYGLIVSRYPLGFEGSMSADIPFGVEPRELSNEPYFSQGEVVFDNIERLRPNLFWAKGFVDIAAKGRGVSLLNTDGDRYFWWRSEDKALEHCLITCITHQTEDWEQWITRSREALGLHSFRESLVFHDGDWRGAEVDREILRRQIPVRAERNRPAPGPREPGSSIAPLEGECSLIEVAPASVHLSTFRRLGEGFELRVVEKRGQRAKAQVRLPFGISQVVETDFKGARTGNRKLRKNGNCLSFTMRPWEIVTMRLERSGI